MQIRDTALRKVILLLLSNTSQTGFRKQIFSSLKSSGMLIRVCTMKLHTCNMNFPELVMFLYLLTVPKRCSSYGSPHHSSARCAEQSSAPRMTSASVCHEFELHSSPENSNYTAADATLVHKNSDVGSINSESLFTYCWLFSLVSFFVFLFSFFASLCSVTVLCFQFTFISSLTPPLCSTSLFYRLSLSCSPSSVQCSSSFNSSPPCCFLFSQIK